MRDVLLVLAVFLACAVEAVEALTIVLAVGVSRGWRSALQGVAAGLLALTVIVAALGPALTLVPLDALRLVVGGLLLVFGLGWLRKAILRASGFKALHDEDAIYVRQLAAARGAGQTRRASVEDWYAFTLSFKGVLLEGLEVAFIVITFGSNQGSIALAALGAAVAVGVVTLAGARPRHRHHPRRPDQPHPRLRSRHRTPVPVRPLRQMHRHRPERREHPPVVGRPAAAR